MLFLPELFDKKCQALTTGRHTLSDVLLCERDEGINPGPSYTARQAGG